MAAPGPIEPSLLLSFDRLPSPIPLLVSSPVALSALTSPTQFVPRPTLSFSSDLHLFLCSSHTLTRITPFFLRPTTVQSVRPSLPPTHPRSLPPSLIPLIQPASLSPISSASLSFPLSCCPFIPFLRKTANFSKMFTKMLR